MGRAPFNVMVYPYRWVGEGELEYALFKRADLGFWQGVTGGGERDETPAETARREAYEEAGIPSDAPFLQLDTVEPIPAVIFGDGHLWGDDVYIVPQYGFGVRVEGEHLVLSREHSEYRWLSYEEAYRLLVWDGNRTALWELNQRLTRPGGGRTRRASDVAKHRALILERLTGPEGGRTRRAAEDPGRER